MQDLPSEERPNERPLFGMLASGGMPVIEFSSSPRAKPITGFRFNPLQGGHLNITHHDVL